MTKHGRRVGHAIGLGWLLATCACSERGDAAETPSGTPAVTAPAAGTGGVTPTPATGTGGMQPSASAPIAPSLASGGDPTPGTGGTSGTSGAGAEDAGGSVPEPVPDGGTPDPGMALGPTLPAITDPGAPGPFQVRQVATASGLSTHSLFVPSALNSAGKHPTVVWTCGNGGTVSFYMSFLEHVASHGFLVVADKASSSDRLAEVASQNAAIDWLVAENAKQGGDFSGKIDLDNLAVMGHSLGSLASFATAAQNARVATSVHFSGGLTGNPVGFDESWLADMTKPAAFLCGGADGTAGPACAQDFAQAPPTLPVFYGVLAGASHIGPFAGTPRAGQYGRAGVAWLRWQLANDPAFKPWFAGASCTLCSAPWTAQQRNLD